MKNVYTDLALNSNKITDLATPTSENDAATKVYVDGYTFTIAGNITSTTSYPITLSGITCSVSYSEILDAYTNGLKLCPTLNVTDTTNSNIVTTFILKHYAYNSDTFLFNSQFNEGISSVFISISSSVLKGGIHIISREYVNLPSSPTTDSILKYNGALYGVTTLKTVNNTSLFGSGDISSSSYSILFTDTSDVITCNHTQQEIYEAIIAGSNTFDVSLTGYGSGTTTYNGKIKLTLASYAKPYTASYLHAVILFKGVDDCDLDWGSYTNIDIYMTENTTITLYNYPYLPINNLTSTETKTPLSAYQGNVLNTTKQNSLVWTGASNTIKTINTNSLQGSGDINTYKSIYDSSLVISSSHIDWKLSSVGTITILSLASAGDLTMKIISSNNYVNSMLIIHNVSGSTINITFVSNHTTSRLYSNVMVSGVGSVDISTNTCIEFNAISGYVGDTNTNEQNIYVIANAEKKETY